ncbi:MAG: hypothetical protein NZL95_01720 [Chitinophagales bacterium]|nr:hypothetical protein [Chitinophagales bacterium]MDW8427254.1 hypothetical protein [Chitinophagales bacterium]
MSKNVMLMEEPTQEGDLLRSLLARTWPQTVSVEELASMLQPCVLQLVQTDRFRLKYLLYRMDVNEEHALRALQLPAPQAAAALALLIAYRYQKKAAVAGRQNPADWKDP